MEILKNKQNIHVHLKEQTFKLDKDKLYRIQSNNH